MFFGATPLCSFDAERAEKVTMEEVILSLQEHDDIVVLFGARQRVSNTLKKVGVFKLLGPERIATSRVGALRIADAYIKHGNG